MFKTLLFLSLLSTVFAKSNSLKFVDGEFKEQETRPRFLAGYEYNSFPTQNKNIVLKDQKYQLHGFQIGVAFEKVLSGKWSTTTTPNFSYTEKSSKTTFNENTFNATAIKVNQSLDYNILAGNTILQPFIDLHLGVGSFFNSYVESDSVSYQKDEYESIGVVYGVGTGLNLKLRGGITPFIKASYRIMYANKQKVKTTFQDLANSSEQTTTEAEISGKENRDFSSVSLVSGIGYSF